jgi:hypothetical protein
MGLGRAHSRRPQRLQAVRFRGEGVRLPGVVGLEEAGRALDRDAVALVDAAAAGAPEALDAELSPQFTR